CCGLCCGLPLNHYTVITSASFNVSRSLILWIARTQEQSEVGNLLRYLEELPLRSWSYLLNHAGKLLASYKLFVAHKAVFHDALYELGQLDALLSITTLMEETRVKGTAHAYAFTKFVEPSQAAKPHLALTAMWNPMLEPAVAVGNDITMDVGGVQTVVLTGPNAGGKSTFLTGVTYSILLSQVFGIAPAQLCELTPFSSINTYIDVTDDIAAGKSLFMAEVARFQDHLNRLRKLKRHELSFSIFDEPFSGTNPTEGAAAEYSVLNSIADYQNTLNIVATHYPMVMLLEKREPTKGFKNYQVYITKDEGGRIQYSYKIIPGESTQTIAIDILEEEGYSSEMLKQARDIIDNPDKYKKSFTEPKKPAKKTAPKSNQNNSHNKAGKK
ncbi:MutS-related protein, partial [Candidatus Cardinium hertigii]|uniref:MutS-related protein n=1 Tax=Candidatus Cardinium hertigii TaxID=247481 RepID=UPI001C841E6F